MRVRGLMPPAPGKARAGLRPGRRVNSRLQAQAVYVRRERIHVGEVPVGKDVPCGVAERPDAERIGIGRAVHPAIIDVYVLVSGVGHPGRHHNVCRFADERIGDAAVMSIPVVPSHGGGKGQPLTAHDPQPALRPPVSVRGTERHGILTCRRRTPADYAGRLIDTERRGEILGPEQDRALPRAGDPVEKRVPRATTVDAGAVYARSRAGRGGQYEHSVRGVTQVEPGCLLCKQHAGWEERKGAKKTRHRER